MLDCSILEKLTLNFLGDVPFSSLDNEERYVLSIMNNIQRILNTHRGSMKNLPDYGLPDLSVIYQYLPSSLHLLQKYIIFTLLKYEPRLQSVQIKIVDSKTSQFVIEYELICQIDKIGFIRFSTLFNSDKYIYVCK